MAKRSILGVGFIASALLVLAVPLSFATTETVELRWALGAVDGDGDQPVAILKDTTLDGGTRLKFLVEPISSSSVYLILLDSRDEIAVLYRQTDSTDPERAYVPGGNGWFRLDDDEGRETFFLLVSAEPLNDLERLLAEHGEADDAGKRELSGAIVREIRRVQRANRRFARAVEKPVMIGGRTRSVTDPETALDRLAVEISAPGFYGKTITIDH